jgi:hypothetical protein
MKRKDLAEVLLKVLGVSMCLYAVPGIFSEILLALIPLWNSATPSSPAHDEAIIRSVTLNVISFGVREVVELGIGILVIVKSRKISEFLFKNEAE